MEDAESDIAILFVDENDCREISAKAVSAKRKLKNSTAGKSLTHWIFSQDCSGSFIIYSLKREISGLIFTPLLVFYYSSKITLGVLIVQTTSFNRPAKFLILLKHWGYENFELNWSHGLSKSLAISFSQVSADSFRLGIQGCSRSLYAFIAFRPTCFARRLVMRNLHETSTQRAR